jgi:hypothetical protein
MKYLVFCSCGHTLEDHGPGGCTDATAGPCGCHRDQIGALEAAVDRVKTDAVATWRSPGEPGDAITA